MSTTRSCAVLVVILLGHLCGAALAQTPPAGPVGTFGEATNQDYALRLRDAEAKLRSAHERLAAAGSPTPRTTSETSARRELLDAAREAWDTVRNAPRTVAGHPAQVEAERRLREGVERLGGMERRDEAEADTARTMLQALATLREAAGAPPAAPATGGSAPAEPAAGDGGRT